MTANEYLHQLYPTGRKICTSPYHVGPRWVWIGDFDFRGKKWIGENEFPVGGLQSWCRACHRVRSRHYTGMRNRGKPYNIQHPPRDIRERRREFYQRLKKDPKRYEARKQYQKGIRKAKAEERASKSRLVDDLAA